MKPIEFLKRGPWFWAQTILLLPAARFSIRDAAEAVKEKEAHDLERAILTRFAAYNHSMKLDRLKRIKVWKQQNVVVR